MRKVFCFHLRKSVLAGFPILMMFSGSFPAMAQEPNFNPPQTAKPQAAAANHPLTNVLRLAKESRDRLKTVQNYQCRFVQRDWVRGKVYVHSASVKFRKKPFSVYMRFDKPNEGREALYVAGQNGGKLLAHESGLLALAGTVALLPNSPQAMSESRHSIAEFGLENLVDRAITQWEQEARFAGSETETKFYPKAKLHTMECQVIETHHPVRRKQFPFYMTRLFLDKTTLFQCGWSNTAFRAKPARLPR